MHVQSCCFAYKTYCFLTLSFPSASLDLKVPNVSKTCHRVFRGSRSDLIIMLYSYQIVHVPEKDLTTPLCLKNSRMPANYKVPLARNIPS